MRARLGSKVTGNFRKSVEREIMKYRGDHYLWHKHISGIELNPHQVMWMNEMDTKGDSHMLIGSRRIRKSFTVAAYFLEEAACLKYSEVNVHSPALEQSKRNLRYMTDMVLNSEILLAYIDNRLGEGLGKEHIEFMNRSLIQAKGQASSVDGLGATHQWLEEFDDMDFDSFLTRVYPTGSQIKDDHDYGNHTGCCRVITGTIKGIGNIHAIEHPENSRIKFNVLPKLNCFTPETLVLTSEGPKEISRVGVDDLVVTDQGCWKPVKQLHVNDYEGDLIVVTLAYGSGLPIRCTPNHKFFTERGEVRADELTTSDIVLCHDTVPNTPPPVTAYEITPDMAYLMGLHLADGCIGIGEWVSGLFVNFSFNHEYQCQIDIVENMIERVTGKTPRRCNSGTTVQIWACGNGLVEHFNAYFGRYSREKSIHPSIEMWDDELKSRFLQGYFTGDGFEQKNSNSNNTCISSKTVNSKIAVGISRLLTQLGVRPTLNGGWTGDLYIDSKKLNGADYWRVQTERIHKIADIGNTHHGKQDSKTGQVVKIQREQYSGKVYNLGVKDIHSYTLSSCGVKVYNCWHGVAMGIIPENDIYLFQSISTPHQFARTYLVLYVESSAFYPDRWVRNCADNEFLPIEVNHDPKITYQATGDVTVGIDCAGAGSGEEASMWTISFTEKIGNQVFLLHLSEYPANERPDVVLESMFRLIAFFKPLTGYGDAFDVAFLYDLNLRLRNEGVTRIDVQRFENKSGANGWDEWYIKPIRFIGPTKHLMHERMQKYVYSCHFRYPAIVSGEPGYGLFEKLLKQLGNIKAERTQSGYNKYSILSEKLGDDLVDATIASVWAQEEIKVVVVPVGGFVPQMGIADAPGFSRLGPRFLNDGRRFNSPTADASLYDFLKE